MTEASDRAPAGCAVSSGWPADRRVGGREPASRGWSHGGRTGCRRSSNAASPGPVYPAL